jgi:formamidopyrimidine-DNA glycosylase
MPELPEVQTVCASLHGQLAGLRIDRALHAGKLRQSLPLPELDAFCRGKTIVSVNRRAKYILVHFSDGSGLILHLGMTGCFIINENDDLLLKHERASWLLADGRRWRFCDTRGFGSLQICQANDGFEKHPTLIKLGLEPLEEAFNGKALKKICAGRKVPIKSLIMDQSRIVGVGNIYASEALFRARISPSKVALQLSLARCQRLAEAIKEVLLAAIEAGGSSIRDFQHVDGSEGHFAVQLRVYGKTGQPCPECGSEIKRITQGGRSTFFCPKCQRN